jgi:hypothetical protein
MAMLRSLSFIATVAACGLVLANAVTPLQAAERRLLLSDVLEKCNGDEASCLSNIKNNLIDASQFGYACPAADISLEEAEKRLLAWLRARVASDPEFAQRESVDAQIEAYEALWPCP